MLSLREWNYLRIENYLSKKFDLGYIESSNVPAFISIVDKEIYKDTIYLKGRQASKELLMEVKKDGDRYLIDFS